MWIAKAVSLTVMAPLAAMLAAGAVSACLNPSPEAPKDAAPPAAAAAKDPAPVAPPPGTGAQDAPPSAEQARPAAQEPTADPHASPPPVYEPPPSGPQRSRAQCTTLWNGMQQKVQQFDASHSACKGDADCAAVPARACLGACDTAVTKEAVKEREELFSKINQNECRAFIGGCSRTMPIPVPSCAMQEPVCTGGRCGAKMKR